MHMGLSQTMGAAFGKVKRLKTSALEIPRCCRENKQEKHSCALSTGNVSVVFPQVCAAVVGQVRCSRARLAGWHCYPTPNSLPQGSLGDPWGILKQSLCSYRKLRHSKASIPTKCLWLCWHSTGRVLVAWMLELFFKRSP